MFCSLRGSLAREWQGPHAAAAAAAELAVVSLLPICIMQFVQHVAASRGGEASKLGREVSRKRRNDDDDD